MFTNPLKSFERETEMHDLIANDVHEAGFACCKPLSFSLAFYSFTRFIWKIGARTITMPTIDLEQSRG